MGKITEGVLSQLKYIQNPDTRVPAFLWRLLPQHLKYIQAGYIWDGTDLFQYLCTPNISELLRIFGSEVRVSLHLRREYSWYLTIVNCYWLHREVFGTVDMFVWILWKYLLGCISVSFFAVSGRTDFVFSLMVVKMKFVSILWKMVMLATMINLKIRFLPALQQIQVFSLIQSSNFFSSL